MLALEIFGNVIFWLSLIAGLFIIPVGLPGTFLILGSAFVYALITGFYPLSWTVLAALLLIAVAAEIVEFFLGAAAARRFGGSKAAVAGAILGGIAGAIWATPLFPVLGTVAGAFVGCFAGATMFEYLSSHDFQKSMRVGTGAFLGALGGRLTKVAAGCAMVVMIGYHIYL
jgi:uncharacterized protein YqgC (DUF456 family)